MTEPIISEQQILEQLAPEKIRSWLLSCDRHAFVGRANSQNNCVLSKYFQSLGYSNVRIGNFLDLSSFSIGETSYNLPKWLEHYACDLDEQAPYGYDETNELESNHPGITAQLALDILEATLKQWDEKKSARDVLKDEERARSLRALNRMYEMLLPPQI